MQGKVLLLGNNINTDEIISGKYLRNNDPKVWGDHVFESLGSRITTTISRCKFIVAGSKFGIGSSREQAAIALKEAKIEIIFAKSFVDIFYRNLINNGIWAFVIKANAKIDLQMEESIMVNLQEYKMILENGKNIFFCKPELLILKIMENGGLISYFKKYGAISF